MEHDPFLTNHVDYINHRVCCLLEGNELTAGGHDVMFGPPEVCDWCTEKLKPHPDWLLTAPLVLHPKLNTDPNAPTWVIRKIEEQ